jgi:signal transduction histidine kinase
VATKIAEAYDSALIRQKANDAALVTTIYDTKGKERQIVEKEAELSQQRLGYSAIVLMILVGVFLEYTIHRRKAYNKLNAINRELTQANQRTEEVSQMKSKFIKEIFHEVRTPLNALQGFTQVLANPEITLSNEEMQKISKMMQENSDRITRIVDKMLDFNPSREDQNYATPQ